MSCIEIQEIVRKQEWQTGLPIYYKVRRVADQQLEWYAVEIRDTEGE
jgi:hypothetical protein